MFFNNLQFEPKRMFRFMVTFTGPGLASGLKYMVTKADKPAFTSDIHEHQVLNHVFKFPGVVKWTDISVTFIDAVEPNVGSTFYAALLNAGYAKPLSEDEIASGFTKFQTHQALGEVKIQQLDGGTLTGAPIGPGDSLTNRVADTNIIEEWTLKNAFIKGASWGDLSYSEEGLVEVKIDLAYDYADLTIRGTPLQKNK